MKIDFPAASGAKLLTTASLVALIMAAPAALAQQAEQHESIVVNGTADRGYGTAANYAPGPAELGPLGDQPIKDLPQSISEIPQDLLANQQVQTVNDALRYLPSVEVRDQQGLEVSRPQSRGFQGSIVQNTRMDGLNVVGTTAIPAESLDDIQVLNGLAGALYGPETPAGVFNYVLKRPTAEPMLRLTEGFDSDSIFTESVDAGGTIDGGKIGYRFNAVRGDGQSYVAGSSTDRTLLSAAMDFHLDEATVIETNYQFYETNITGLPGSIVYDGAATTVAGHKFQNTILPAAIDPTEPGFGQPGAGADLISNTAVVKIKHQFNENWSIEAGGLYDDAIRNLLGITNTLIDNSGQYTVTKNFTAVPHFTVGSNELYLNGKIDILGAENDLTIGTNGFINGQYSFRNSIAVNLTPTLNNLGAVASLPTLSDPQILPTKVTPANGGTYMSGQLWEQSIITGDTVHFTDQLALQAVLNTSFIGSKSYSNKDVQTSSDERDGELSPTTSLIYKPIPALTTYATFALSVEQGEQAAATNANSNQFLAPYHDRSYEVGAKYAINDGLLLTLDGFRMTRPLANTSATTNLFEVVGTQRNWGGEAFLEGIVTPELSVIGGLDYIDARLVGTDSATTNDKLVVGVPHYKLDLEADYHPDFIPGFAVTGAVHAESDRAATNTNNTYAPSYSTFDLGARYSTGAFGHPATLRFQVINVGDTQYFSSIADGNIVGSPGANTAYSGAPRTFELSLEMDF